MWFVWQSIYTADLLMLGILRQEIVLNDKKSGLLVKGKIIPAPVLANDSDAAGTSEEASTYSSNSATGKPAKGRGQAKTKAAAKAAAAAAAAPAVVKPNSRKRGSTAVAEDDSTPAPRKSGRSSKRAKS